MLVLLFVTILLMVFAIVALMLRPTQEQKAVEQRLASVVAISPDTIGPAPQEYARLAEAASTGWMDTVGKDLRLLPWLKLMILRSQKNTTPEAIVTAMAALGLGGFFLVYVLSSMIPVALLAGLLAGYAPIVWLTFHCRKRLAAFNAALPDCIETCSRSLRAGHSIAAALDIVAELSVEPAKTEFSEVFKKQNYGLPLRDALLQMLERVPSPDLQVFVTAVLVQKDTGGNLAEILDRSAVVIRDRIRIQREIRTHTAQGRMTGWVLVFLPVVMMLIINVVNPGYSTVLFHDPMGKKLLYGGLVLLLIGGVVIRQIVNGIEV